MSKLPPNGIPTWMKWLLAREQEYEKSGRWSDAENVVARDIAFFLTQSQMPRRHPAHEWLCHFTYAVLRLGYLVGRTDADVVAFLDQVDFEQEENSDGSKC